MKIKLDDKHWLNSDRFSFWITGLVEPSEEENKNKKRKAQKPYERRVSGYQPTYGQAVASFIDYAVKESQAKTLTALKRDIDKLKKTVLGWEHPSGD